MNLEFLNVTMKNHSEEFTSLLHTSTVFGKVIPILPEYATNIFVLRAMGYFVTKTSGTTDFLLIFTPIAASCHACLKHNCPGEETSLRA